MSSDPSAQSRNWIAPFADAAVALGDWSLFAFRTLGGIAGRAFSGRELLRVSVEVGANSGFDVEALGGAAAYLCEFLGG